MGLFDKLFGKKEKGVIKDTAYVPSKEESDIPIASAINFDDRVQLKSFVEETLKDTVVNVLNRIKKGNLTKSERLAAHALAGAKVEDAVKELIQLEKRSDEEITNIIVKYATKCAYEFIGLPLTQRRLNHEYKENKSNF